MMLRLVLCLAASPSAADSVIAVTTIQAGQTIMAEDLLLVQDKLPGAVSSIGAAAGLSARGTIYAGQTVQASDLVEQGLVERNALVRLVYRQGSVRIELPARALDDGHHGALVRVMNMESRNIVMGTVTAAATVTIGEME